MATRTRKKAPVPLARRRADPGLRSKLPTSQLTATQRKERARLARVKADDSNPLYDPSQQLSGHNLATAASRLVDAQLKPKLGAIDTEIGSAKTQGTALLKRAGAYYGALGGEDQSNAAKMAALAAMTNSTVAGNNKQASEALSQASATEAKRQADDAALRGGGLGGDTSTVPGVISRAQSQQAILAPAVANAAAAQGAGWAGLSQAMAQARQMRGGEIQGELSNAQMNSIAKLAQAKADLEGSRGDLTVKQIQDLRQQGFENIATVQGLGLKQADIQATVSGQKTAAQTAAANRKQAAADRAASRDVTTRGQDLSHTDRVAGRQAAAQKKAAAEKKRQQAADSKTRTAAAKAWGTVESVLGKVNSGARVPVTQNGVDTGKTRSATTSETISALRAANTPEWAVQAAVSIRHHGYVTAPVIALIRRTAPQVRIPMQYRPPELRRRSGVGAYDKGSVPG